MEEPQTIPEPAPPTMQHPEEVLDALAAKNPGLSVAIEAGLEGHTLLHLDCASGHRVLTVVEPPEGWPVRVTHYHAHPLVTTTYRYALGHDPNKTHPHKVDPDVPKQYSLNEAAELLKLREADATPEIDTVNELHELCEHLLQHHETKLGRTRKARHAARMARRTEPTPPLSPSESNTP